MVFFLRKMYHGINEFDAWLQFFPFFSRFAFESVVRSMLSVGFEEDEIVAVVALLAGIILIGDIVS